MHVSMRSRTFHFIFVNIPFDICLDTYTNSRKFLSLKYPGTGGYMEFDFWIPSHNLCFEFQVTIPTSLPPSFLLSFALSSFPFHSFVYLFLNRIHIITQLRGITMEHMTSSTKKIVSINQRRMSA